MSDVLSPEDCAEVANKFVLHGKGQLGKYTGIKREYAFVDDIAVVRNEVLHTPEESLELGGVTITTTVEQLPIVDFVGGVTYALAEKGDIPMETATAMNVARICFILSRLTRPVAGTDGTA